MAIAEVLVVAPAVARAIAAGESAQRIAALAEACGMRSLWAAGAERVAAGETTLDELTRVLGAVPAHGTRGRADELPAAAPARPAPRGSRIALRVTADGGAPLPAAELDALRAVLADAGYAVAPAAGAPAEPNGVDGSPRRGLVVARPGARSPSSATDGASDGGVGTPGGERPGRRLRDTSERASLPPASPRGTPGLRAGYALPGLRAWAVVGRTRPAAARGTDDDRPDPPSPRSTAAGPPPPPP
jgi:hypothetical protein